MQAKEYRPDIDVLRAIAVLAVIFYHANIPFFNGGYVGVSIFFVISGYLITGIIKRKLENGTFSFLEFYENRIRRILPALLAMLFITSLLVLITSVDNGEVKLIQSSFKRCILAIPNIFFYLNTNYFDPAADTMHFLHTWSLGVEEQFYFIIPALLVILSKKLSEKIKIIHILWLLFFLSFISSIIIIEFSQKFTFYMLPTRAWELLIGSLLAYTAWTPKTQHGKIVCASLGLIIMITTIFGYGKETFPGFWAFPPCLGACLYIAGNTNINTTILDTITKNSVLIFVGVISYSLYLWHWPILVFYSTFPSFKEITPTAGILLSLLSFFIAVLSWHFIEKPVRQKPFFKNRKRLWFGTICLLAVSLGYAGHFSLPLSAKSNYVYSQQQDMKSFGIAKNDNSLDVLVIGDSHSIAASTAIKTLCDTYGLYGERHFYFLKNVFNEGDNLKFKKDKEKNWQEFTDFLTHNKINTIIFAYRFNMHLYGADLIQRESQIKNMTYIKNPDFSRTEAFYHSLKDMIDEALTLGVKNIIIQLPVPEAKSSVPQSAGKLSSFFGYTENEINLHLGESVKHYNERLTECLSVFEKIKTEYPQIYWADVKPYLLDKKQQVYKVINGNEAFYFDDDHLSVEGTLHALEAYEKIFKIIFNK